jgi:hypothetical protein
MTLVHVLLSCECLDIPCAALSCKRACMSFTNSLPRVSACCQIRDALHPPYAAAALGLLEAERHIRAILLGPHNEGICRRLAWTRMSRGAVTDLAASGSRHLWIFWSRGAGARGRLRTRRGSSLRPVVAHVSLGSHRRRQAGGDGDRAEFAGHGATAIDLHLQRRPCRSRCRGRTSHCS